jgi:hypothetical protein
MWLQILCELCMSSVGENAQNRNEVRDGTAESALAYTVNFRYYVVQFEIQNLVTLTFYQDLITFV